jgi:hypothetical protein
MGKSWLPLLLIGAVAMLLAVFLWSRPAEPPLPSASAGDESEVASSDALPSPAPDPAAPATTGSPRPEAFLSAPDADAAESETPVVEADPAVSLDRLLTWQDEPSPEKGLDLGAGTRASAPTDPGGTGLGSPVYLERRTEDAQTTDQERRRQQTEVGVKVPVGSAARLRGGVRVESAEESESAGKKDVERAATVGVEIDF